MLPQTTKQIAVGIELSDMLEWTFVRGESLEERIVNVAREKARQKWTEIDFDNGVTVSVYNITAECDEIEVVFNVEEIK